MAPTAATASPQTVGHILPHEYSRSGASTPSRSLRPVHGRGFSVQLTAYAGHLPGDDLEQSRLDTQHQAIKLNLGELFACPELVRAALAPRDDRRPAILDVGTGSGAWAVDMSKEFPHCDVVGMDLVEPKAGESGPSLPPNCRLEVGDANTYCGLQPEASFDVIHKRAAEPGIRDFHGFLYDCARALRPGGVLLLASGSPQMYDRERNPFPVTDEGEPGFTYAQRTFGAVYEASLKSGNRNGHHSFLWDDWIKSNPNFEHIEAKFDYIPLGEYGTDVPAAKKEAARKMRTAFAQILDSFKPMLITAGMDQETADAWVKVSIEELTHPETFPEGYVRWRYTTAIRKDTPFVPRTDLPGPVDHSKIRIVVPRTSDFGTGPGRVEEFE
ncbi:hypothetical protein FRC04_007725 [Tulasnella sp. 424]|nr:hypothetical protein FRC04_007725 [Tulasnella sp. 424]